MAVVSVSTIENFGARVRTPGYLILTLATAMPLIDFVTSLWPPHLADPSWRLSAVGLFSSYAVGTLVELVLILALAVASNDRKVLITLGVIAALLAVLLLAASAMFALDGLQIRGRIAPQNIGRFDFTIGQGLVKLLLVFVSNAVLSRASFKAARGDGRANARVKGIVTPLVTGQPSTSRQSAIPDAKVQK